jgi:hypothetical protein
MQSSQVQNTFVLLRRHSLRDIVAKHENILSRTWYKANDHLSLVPIGLLVGLLQIPSDAYPLGVKPESMSISLPPRSS